MLYDAAAHRSLVTRFGQDLGVANLSFRSLALGLLGYPSAAQSDYNDAIRDAREIGHPASLMLALIYKNLLEVFLTGDYQGAMTSINEVVSLAETSGALMWKVAATYCSGYVYSLTGKPFDGLPLIETNVAIWKSAGAKMVDRVQAAGDAAQSAGTAKPYDRSCPPLAPRGRASNSERSAGELENVVRLICSARRTQIRREGHSSQFATPSASAAQTFPLAN
jgi:hypothetical protein